VQQQAFKKKKAVDIAQAIINGALAITKVTAQTGVLSPFAIPTIVATTGAQVATIAAQKFKDGGRFLSGPSHENGGMPILNPTTGQKVAEVEGGEFIIRKRSVTAQTMPLLERINQSNGNMSSLNLDGYQNSIRRFRNGGRFELSGDGDAAAGSAASVNNGTKEIVDAVSSLGQMMNSWQREFQVTLPQQKIDDAQIKKAKVKKYADIRA
jgi:hypothetical protein